MTSDLLRYSGMATWISFRTCVEAFYGDWKMFVDVTFTVLITNVGASHKYNETTLEGINSNITILNKRYSIVSISKGIYCCKFLVVTN